MICTLREWQKTHKNIKDLIVQASVKDGSDSWTPFPIGMSWQYEKEADKVAIQLGSHTNLVLCAVNPSTDLERRPEGINRQRILQNLKKNNIHNTILDSNKYFSSLPSYKFVISPEGNGLDCHRHYEALLAGCIPIIESNSQIEDKYKGLPVIFTNDYSEINLGYLYYKYNIMIDSYYDFKTLFKSFYKDHLNEINDTSKYWIEKMYKPTPDLYFKSICHTPLVWITIINKAYIDFTKNFLKSMDIHSCGFKLVVYCLDKEIIEELKNYENAICFDASFIVKDSIKSELTEWFTVDYKRIVFSKLDAIKYTIKICNEYGIWAVGYIDTDIIVFKNPSSVIQNYMKFNHSISVFSQCDEDMYSENCSNPYQCPHICSGVIVFRTGSIDCSIFEYSNDDILHYNSDQEYLVNVLTKKAIPRLTIPKDIFLNGAYPGVKELRSLILPESACLLHYNYMNNNKKQLYMKQNSMWYV